ncbi:MAG: TolB family protein [Flavisolibacter sp.]
MKRFLILLPYFFCAFLVRAQNFGGFPPSTRWRQINTDTARIIFSKGAEQQAQRIATLIHRQAADTSFSLGPELKKINIILQSRTTLANGYVALAPFRSEYYLIPSSNVFDFGNLPWEENLALHEYRHVRQYNNFRNGLSRGFYDLFGEQGLALANALTIPDWFFEGDAVHAETAFSGQGRGRLPYFLSAYKSLWLEGKNYSWQKLRNGSLKDYVPDHYALGYLLVNYGYLRYGSDFWRKVTQDASAFKGLFYPFQKAIKKYSGLDYTSFRKEALDFYRQKLGTPPGQSDPSRKKVVNYYFPQFIGRDSLLYLKKTYGKIPAFYLRDPRGEHRLGQQSISAEEWFSYRKGKLVYTAYSTHPRWGLIDYSDIILKDLSGGSEKRLTSKSRYYTPDLSPTGKIIIAVRINDSLQTELQVLQASDGAILKRIPSLNQYYYLNPRFVDEDKIVVATRTPDSRMALQILDLRNNNWEEIVPFSQNTIALPFVADNTVYFVSDASANDDIYAVRLHDRSIFQVTRNNTGDYYPAVWKDSLAWVRFTAEGLDLKTSRLDPTGWVEINKMTWPEEARMYPVAFAKVPFPASGRRFAEKRYSQSTGLFHFHSWAPDYSDPEFTFSVYSDNILNTFSNQVFYRYNRNESSHALGWNTAYAGFFPVLSAGAEYTYGRHLDFSNGSLTLDQLEVRGGFNIPLDFTRGRSYKLLNFGSDYVFNRSMPTGFYKDSFSSRNRTYLRHFISWSHYLPRAIQQIYPKLGWNSLMEYRHLLSGNGYQYYGNSFLYLPSFGNHSFVLNGSFQETDTNNVVFSNRFPGSRGYADDYFSRMWKVAGNYHFPILYPDLGFASIVYCQRIRGNLFYDYTRVYSREKTRTANLRSVGAEMFFDTKWWNQLPVSFGFRVSHLLDNGFSAQDRKGKNWFEFILPVNLIPN